MHTHAYVDTLTLYLSLSVCLPLLSLSISFRLCLSLSSPLSLSLKHTHPHRNCCVHHQHRHQENACDILELWGKLLTFPRKVPNLPHLLRNGHDHFMLKSPSSKKKTVTNCKIGSQFSHTMPLGYTLVMFDTCLRCLEHVWKCHSVISQNGHYQVSRLP